ncbi:MAG: 30S ribosomal protein S4 [Clostridiaceae bacterium]|jgi:small subunit ribosomal protein S4|nr:30S ribosomal protein S4 [Bacillota bacterium]NLN52502.1 30S ribosomal protein S4 [Clostridiaceae bacterium]
MARDMSPILKRCRALGIEPQVMGINKKSKRNPQRSRRKDSEYGRQLREKQKVKFIYGVLEKQFRNLFNRASRMSGVTGENLLQLLELRMDNVIYRLRLADTRAQARQYVSHSHFLVNGRRLNVPSATLRVGDVITLKERSKKLEPFTELDEAVIPEWLSMNWDTMEAKVVGLPSREDIDFDVEETLIVELYSR